MDNKEVLLKTLRGRLAYSHQCEPYKIFGNKELMALLEVEPKTLEELATIKGFPSDGKRVANYGEAIIAIFNRPTEVKDFKIEETATGEFIAKPVLERLDLF